ncbi:MAG TPA: EF-P lysine aminoacylase EpmA [Steroidobacteraceae bacterium]|nr:EF-P lysine aminoacylase EpmA [Steroidobacteraceae bacterium]
MSESGPPLDWRPTASREALLQRATLLARVRAFFAERSVLEVETPVLSSAAVSDPQIESLSTEIAGLAGPFHLQTSPEFAMKRLIAAGYGDIYQIARVFRDGERGRWHNPEFTLLEWYRLGFDDAALMREVQALIVALLSPERELLAAERLSYAEALSRHAGLEDAHTASVAELEQAARRCGIAPAGPLERDAWLDLLMGVAVGPRLGLERPCFICDYPASQASLARLKPGSPPRAARFELYIEGLEIANGFHELADAREQRRRFASDLALRCARGQREPPIDERLLAALESGLPECAGVALGFDRLVAIALGARSLSEVIAFPVESA